MIHLTAADYRVMPWANGKGTTTEIWREERDGRLLWRLSRAAVVEDGQFSLFPGINRNLTVISGPGFDLVGAGLHLQARPLTPVSFPGDVTIAAEGVTRPSDDLNVMISQDLPKPIVSVSLHPESAAPPPEGLIALYALAPLTAEGRTLQPSDLLLSRNAIAKGEGPGVFIAIADRGLSQILKSG